MQIKYDESTVSTQQRKRERLVSTFVNQLTDGVVNAFGLGGEFEDLHVLRGVRGVIRPGTTTLILGAPGSGEYPMIREAGAGIRVRMSMHSMTLHNAGKSAPLRAIAGRHPAAA